MDFCPLYLINITMSTFCTFSVPSIYLCYCTYGILYELKHLWDFNMRDVYPTHSQVMFVGGRVKVLPNFISFSPHGRFRLAKVRPDLQLEDCFLFPGLKYFPGSSIIGQWVSGLKGKVMLVWPFSVPTCWRGLCAKRSKTEVGSSSKIGARKNLLWLWE